MPQNPPAGHFQRVENLRFAILKLNSICLFSSGSSLEEPLMGVVEPLERLRGPGVQVLVRVNLAKAHSHLAQGKIVPWRVDTEYKRYMFESAISDRQQF